VEFADSEIEDLSPKRFVQKHLAGDLNADQEPRSSQGGSCEVRLRGVWEASRDPAVPGPPVRRVAAGNRHPAGAVAGPDRGPSAPCGGLRCESVAGQVSLAARGFRDNAH
jgi:hypothetical protein